MLHAGPVDGIRVRSVGRAFGSVRAVRDISLHAPAGEATALVGPNGSGKTTLMLMVAGLLRPDTGTVTVAGYDPATHGAAVQARLGWMPDTFGAWDALRVVEHLELFARAYRMPGALASARTGELLHLVRLTDLAQAPARVLSRGQKQRLALARALVHDPECLVLDEPASGLDPGSRVELRQVLRTLAAQGRAVLVSSHVLSELDEMADGAVFVLDGSTVGTEEVAGAAGRRLWRVRGADTAALDAALLRRGLEVLPAQGGGRDVVLLDDDAAADLLAALVGDGLRLHHFAPSAGRIEQTYLGLTGAGSGSRAER